MAATIPTTADPPNCRCWRCWSQDNFTAVALFGVLIGSIALLVILMHEDKIDDKYVTWMEGFVAGVFSAWTLALNRPADKPHTLAPGTMEQTLRVEPPSPVVVPAVPVPAPDQEVKPVDSLAFRRPAEQEPPKGQ